MSNNDTECELAAWELLAETRRELDSLKSVVVELGRDREKIQQAIRGVVISANPINWQDCLMHLEMFLPENQ